MKNDDRSYTPLQLESQDSLDSEAPTVRDCTRRTNSRTLAVPRESSREAKASPRESSLAGSQTGSKFQSLHFDVELCQFSSDTYFAKEGEDDEIEIDIIRIGDSDNEASVHFHTSNGSAVAGKKYVSCEERVTFAPGETVKTVCVGIIDDGMWDTTLDFTLSLSDPEGCQLGKCISKVKILDNDVFPSNSLKQEIISADGIPDAANCNGMKLVTVFTYRVFMASGMGWRIILGMFIDQLHNAYYVLCAFLGIFLVDEIFGGEGGEERLLRSLPRRLHEKLEHEALELGGEAEEGTSVEGDTQRLIRIVCALYFVPFAVLYLCDCLKVKVDLQGKAQEFLQLNLYRRGLNYSETVRARINPTEMSLAMVKEVQEVVDEGLLKTFALFKLAGKMAGVAFLVYSESPDILIPVFVLPAPILVSALLSLHRFQVVGSNVIEAEGSTAMAVHESFRCYRLIADYHLRGHMQDRFEQRAQHLREMRQPLKMLELQSGYGAPWISVMALVCYLILASPRVLAGELKLGVFLAVVRIVPELGKEFAEVLDEITELSRAIVPLVRLVNLLNADTDLMHRRQVVADRRETLKRMRQESAKWRSDGEAAGVLQDPFEDTVPLFVKSLKFSYVAAYTLIDIPYWEFKQSRLTAIAGAHGSGKTSFLQLLGEVHEHSGEVFIPGHLTVLHVDREPLISQASLWENLTFNNPKHTQEWVVSVLKRLKNFGSDNLIEIVKQELENGQNEDDEDPTHWTNALSSSSTALIHFARAFIANPHVLLAHRPLMHFNDELGIEMIKLLREFVTNRGLELEEGQFQRGISEAHKKRRPRTCIYTTMKDADTEYADTVLILQKGRLAEKTRSGTPAEGNRKAINLSPRQSPRSLSPSRQSPRA